MNKTEKLYNLAFDPRTPETEAIAAFLKCRGAKIPTKTKRGKAWILFSALILSISLSCIVTISYFLNKPENFSSIIQAQEMKRPLNLGGYGT